MNRLLVVEDNKNLRILMVARLEQEGYQVYEAEHGIHALQVLDEEHIELIVCDVMMPEMDGYEFTKTLRQTYCDIPVLMVTAKESFEDIRSGFLSGADDYMIKPINMNEMVLRVSALLRRAKINAEHKIVLGDVRLDYDSLTVSTSQETIDLPKKEFYLLFKLLSYPNQIFTRQQLLDEIWGMEVDVDERTVDSHIKKLRKKFENRKEFKLVTIRGLGYKAEKCV